MSEAILKNLQNRINLIKMHILQASLWHKMKQVFCKKNKKIHWYLIRYTAYFIKGQRYPFYTVFTLGEICSIMNNIQIIEIYLHRLQKLCVKKRKDLEHLAELQKFSCLSGFFSTPSPKQHPHLLLFLINRPSPFLCKATLSITFPNYPSHISV